MTIKEAIETLRANYPDACFEQLRDAVDIAISALKQPEIIRCKDCKHRPKFDEEEEELIFPTYRCPCQCEDFYYSWMPKDDWFCGNGERRTDETD